MIYTMENANRLISLHLKSAHERLEIAELLLKQGYFADSVSRSYYAFLDAATALLIKKDLVPKSHEGTRKLIDLHYIKPGILPKEWGRWFRRAEKAREDADYSHEREFTQIETEEILLKAKEFVEIAERLVSNFS